MLPYARQPPRHRWIVPRRVSPANLLICSSMIAPEDRSLACLVVVKGCGCDRMTWMAE